MPYQQLHSKRSVHKRTTVNNQKRVIMQISAEGGNNTEPKVPGSPATVDGLSTSVTPTWMCLDDATTVMHLPRISSLKRCASSEGSLSPQSPGRRVTFGEERVIFIAPRVIPVPSATILDCAEQPEPSMRRLPPPPTHPISTSIVRSSPAPTLPFKAALLSVMCGVGVGVLVVKTTWN